MLRSPTWLVSLALFVLFLTVVVGFPFVSTDATDASDSTDTVVSDSNSGPSYGQQLATDSIKEGLELAEIPKDFQNSNGNELNVERIDASLTEDVKEFFGESAVSTLGYELLVARLNQYQVDGSLSSRDMEHLDQEIGMLMVAAAGKSSKANAIPYQEVKHLELKADNLLQAATNNPSASLRIVDREVQRLEHQIDVLLISAAEHPFLHAR